MNNIPFFEILVVLFVLWPLIERFLNKNKPRPADPNEAEYEVYPEERAQNASPEVRAQSQPDWDEALRELEMIFTGESKPQTQQPAPQPAPEPVVRQAPRPQQRSAPSLRKDTKTPVSFAKMRPVKMPASEFRDVSGDLIDSDNPIYQSLSKSPELHQSDAPAKYSIFEDIRTPQRLREFYVMKEVLDKPVSLRRKRHLV